MRVPPSIPPQSPIAITDEELGNDKTGVHDTSVFTDEEQEDVTIEQGKLTNHEPLDEQPGNASDLAGAPLSEDQ